MSPKAHYTIAVFAGDGIGHEIMEPCIDLIAAAIAKTGAPNLVFDRLAGGAAAYRDLGHALPKESMQQARAADAILLAAMGDPSIRYPDGTEITPQIELRFALGLYAGLRPIRAIPGVPLPLTDPRAKEIDFVLVRESTEGLFASYGKGIVENDSVAKETLEITRETSEKLFHSTFKLAMQRQKTHGKARVTCVDKANVFSAFAFFRKIFDEVAGDYEIRADHAYVDAMAMWLISRPWEYDVLVTENMFGDILSDQAAALIGGMGYAPSADIGDEQAVFQPCHGSAPDIAGKGLANPTAMFLSGAMMLEWIGQRHQDLAITEAAHLIRKAVDHAFAQGQLITTELGGDAGTEAVTNAVMGSLSKQA